MRLTLLRLKALVREAVSSDCWGGSQPEETYDQELVLDDSFKATSTYVSDETKREIETWLAQLGLSHPHKKKRMRQP